jgi:hypothetical protein
MSKFLFDVQQKNRLEQKGLLQRFSIICYGHQDSIEEMKAEKAAKYKELKQSGNKKELEEWFLNYKPDDIKNTPTKEIKSYKNKEKKPKKKTIKKRVLNPYDNKSRKNKKWLY